MTAQATAPSDSKISLLKQISTVLEKARPRLRDFFVHIVAQVRILEKAYPGIMHFLIFWGVTIQVVGTIINLLNMLLFFPWTITFPRGTAYLIYELVMDIAGVAILIGVIMAFFRRLVLRPKALETRWDDYYALTLLALIPLLGFTMEGTRLLATQPAWAAWSPVGNLVAQLMSILGMTPQVAVQLHDVLWWFHAGVALILVASIPFTKMRHLVYAPLNVIFRPLRKSGAIEKIEDIDTAEILGVGKVSEFTSQQLLSFDACVNCGRCEEVCPSNLSGMEYSPRTLIQTLRKTMVNSLQSPNGKSSQELFAETFSDAYPWQCTTCGACIVRCPAFVNPVDEIIDMRRYQALTTGKVPKSVADALRNIERQGNPWGILAQDRLNWADGLNLRELAPGEETDVLFFVGCASAFDDRNKKVARAFVHLLQKANVNFGVLGLDETCCGETARRMGNEYLFQVFAEQNIEAMSKIKFKRIVTQCPHCFNTLKNEYPQFGSNYKVQHYTEFLSELSLAKGISPNGNGLKGRLTYHDSCYLGRYNQIYQAPRQLLRDASLNPIELPRKGENSFCCGGGGGQMWLETDPNTRINHRRLSDALQVKADVVATACPYCLLMFDDAIHSKGLGEQIQVMDIAEILERQLSG
ncbi:MAG: heterodisulfide reductase-related iron-sulfur binding cluster [Anaerolineales bacterium]